jgi:DNA-binding transcriptional regulator/RsmH inhibitor MraZ
MPETTQVETLRTAEIPPLYAEDSSVDEKGRLKVPVAFQRHLGAKEGATFMATTFDLKMAIVYTSEDFLQFRQDVKMQLGPAKAEPILYVMERFGGVSKLDGEGRLSLPGSLKEQLGLTKRQKVYLRFRNRRIEILREEDYDREFQVHKVNLDDAVNLLKGTGL